MLERDESRSEEGVASWAESSQASGGALGYRARASAESHYIWWNARLRGAGAVGAVRVRAPGEMLLWLAVTGARPCPLATQDSACVEEGSRDRPGARDD